MRYRDRKGTSLIDLIISMGIIAVLFGGIYLVYFSIVTAIGNISVRNAAAEAINQELETIRNLPYASVGTVSGIPSGVIPQAQAVSVGKYNFLLQTTVRNIDDPFDGTLGGTPNDTAPADYKLVSITAACPLCAGAFNAEVTTTVAPKNLESASQDGSLFIYAVDANGNPVSDADVHITNASVTPSIDLTDTTNASGVLQLVGVPTSTQNYAVTVTKPGYSTERTYSQASLGGSTPMKAPLTAVAQTVTAATFAIDKTSQLTVYTSDDRCNAIGSESFTMHGSKLIGTSPNVVKFSTSSVTNASGSLVMNAMEWDTYFFQASDTAKNLAGTIPLNPTTINPGATTTLRLVLQPSANPSLMATIIDAATGAGISNATVTISKAGFSDSAITGHKTISQTDWSGGQFANQSGGIAVNATPGSMSLVVNASGTYNPLATEWLISNTFDLGGSSSTFYELSWNPTVQPTSTGPQSLAFQIATNNDNATWNYVGPDGTAGTYFTSSPVSLPGSLFGNRYVRYKVFMSTQAETQTPRLDDIAISFNANCVPPAQALFTSLPQGTYTIDVMADNYNENSTTVSVGAGFQSSTISLIHV